MKRENLVERLGKMVLPYLLTGALAFSTLFNYRCTDGFVEPEPEKPVAMFIAQPTEGDAPLEVSFDGSTSYARAPKSHIEKYLWDFDGDGDIDKVSGQPGIYHIYQSRGEYDASLVVEDTQGQRSDKVLEKIVVSENIVSLGTISFTSQKDYQGVKNEDIYSGNIVLRVKDDNIQLVDIKRLTTDPKQDFESDWSPDGSKIVFTSNKDDYIRLYTMNADGTERTILTPNIQHAMSPNWSSDGKKIVFSYIDSGFAGIEIINPNEDSFIPIYSELQTGSVPGYPSWSPDCSKIAFQKYINGNWEIHTINADGTGLENLTNNYATDQQPTWSSDGKILYWSDEANPNQIPIEADLYLMNADGSNPVRLTYASGTEIDPGISQDGKYILFTRYRLISTPLQIYLTELINADDETKWIQLTTEGENGYPAWSPKKED